MKVMKNMKNMKSEQLLYKGNTLSYMLILFSGFISAYGNVIVMRDESFVTNYLSAFYVIGTIVNLLFLFYTAIQIKDYKSNWIKYGAIFGVTLVLRLFVVPEGLDNSVFLMGLISAFISIALLYTGIYIGNTKITERNVFIEENDINMKELFN